MNAKHEAIKRGLAWAESHGMTKPADIAICIEVELREAGYAIYKNRKPERVDTRRPDETTAG